MASSASEDNSTIQAVIFDLDGVLMDSEWSAFEAWKEVVRHYGGALHDEVFHSLVGTSQEETAEIIMGATGVTFPVEEACGMAWEMVIGRLKAGVNVLPGARELVMEIAGRGLPTAIASNSISQYIGVAVEGLRLKEYFHALVGVDQVARGKPAPDVYLAAAERLGMNPLHCLAVEDSRVGVRAAASAGMRVIAVPDRRDERPGEGYDLAWRVYPALTGVLDGLDEILAAPRGGAGA